ncbi:MAG TPA: hypothetical protein VHX59_11990 [Mycobacteriales bacterium]|nr:hypothetical protein [Mycobacteriales bacterium]
MNELTELVATAFEVGRPTGPMTPVRHGTESLTRWTRLFADR